MQTTQRFEGPSLESALSAAVSVLGPNLKVADARRVRRGGVGGFFSREQFEVIATPATPSTDGSEAAVQASVDDALLALVENVEDQAEAPSFEAALAAASRRDPVVVHDDGLDLPLDGGLDLPLEPEPARPRAKRSRPLRAATRPEPAPVIELEPEETDEVVEEIVEEIAEAPAHLPVLAPLPSQQLVVPAVAPVLPLRPGQPVYDTNPGWSRAALVALGVPAPILEQLRGKRLSGDSAWTAALADAIAAVVPPAAPPGPGSELCVSGHGAASAVKILQAGVNGFTPGLLHLDGREAAASPMELALAVRACLPR